MATYKIMNITKDKQLIGQDITLTKKGVKDGVVHFSDLNKAINQLEKRINKKLNKIDITLNKIIKKLGA